MAKWRQDARALAQRAAAEGETARGVDLASRAGQAFLTAYRRGGGVSDDDARDALQWLTFASKPGVSLESCRAARLRATLLGERARDPELTYGELYMARRRFALAPCVGDLENALSRVSHFRPPPPVLLGLDRALEHEGLPAMTATPDAGSEAQIVKVVRVTRWTTAESARLVVELDRPAAYRLEERASGALRLTLSGVRPELPADEEVLARTRGLLAYGRVHAGRSEGSEGSAVSTSIDLEVTRPCYRRVFFLPEPFRVVVDLDTRAPGTTDGSGPRPLRRVVLDPGHGGADPGAVGPTGVREKDINLAIAKVAAPLVARELGAEVRLTRGADRFVSLEERAVVANAFAADVFVSIHCNAAAEARNKRGIEFYVLDTERDTIAARVAARENGGGAAAPSELRAILDDLKLTELGTRSRHLADLFRRATMASLQQDSSFSVFDGGVFGAGFFVLVGARMPAVLIEAAYISNPTEEQYLASADFRARVADGVVNALRAYKDGR